jgi:hypothetical protein
MRRKDEGRMSSIHVISNIRSFISRPLSCGVVKTVNAYCLLDVVDTIHEKREG